VIEPALINLVEPGHALGACRHDKKEQRPPPVFADDAQHALTVLDMSGKRLYARPEIEGFACRIKEQVVDEAIGFSPALGVDRN
jgi:hypothetical protein